MGLLRGKRPALFNTLHVFFVKNRGFIHPGSLSAPVVAAAWQLFRGGVPYVIFYQKLEVKPAQGVPTGGGCCRGSASLPWSQHPCPDLASHLPDPAGRKPLSVPIQALSSGLLRCPVAHGLVSVQVVLDTGPLESPGLTLLPRWCNSHICISTASRFSPSVTALPTASAP